MKTAVFWIVAPCNLVEVYRRFRDACLKAARAMIALMMEAASTSKTSVNFYQATWHNNPEDSHLQEISLYLICRKLLPCKKNRHWTLS
jgi:hypothetical protein